MACHMPEGVSSGLLDAKRRLAAIKGLAMVELARGDIVRHRLVTDIVEAYQRELRTASEPGDQKENSEDVSQQ